MFRKTTKSYWLIVFSLVAVLTLFHYLSPLVAGGKYHLELVVQRLFLLPIVLGCLWFGTAGGLVSCTAVIVAVAPVLVSNWAWPGLSSTDVNITMQVVVYFVIAVVLGKVVDMQKREHSRAKQAENLATIGKSLSAVAHEMKTPLTAIGGFANLVRGHLDDSNPDRAKLDIVISETARLEKLVKDMLDFSRPLEIKRTEVDIGQLVDECIAIVEESAGKNNVRLHKIPCASPLLVFVDPMRIRQVLINLLVNAAQASPAGETVIVRCYLKGKNLLLDVADCGCGIPLENRREIFLPFFTTKKEGTGLGLAIVKKIVDAHGGHIRIISAPGTGITFRVILPQPTGRKQRAAEDNKPEGEQTKRN